MRFHDPDYVAALKRCDAARGVDRATRERHGFGTLENPLFPGVFDRAATAVGGSILAARLAADGRIVFHPSGGTHHGRPDRASGFCYFNDPVFAVLTLLDLGFERVLYVDLDAHHPDGVQDAFLDDARVSMISIHEAERWPGTGAADDSGHGRACNLPVPAGFRDAELDLLLEQAVLPWGRAFEPQALVLTCGADAVHGDPLSRLALSNVALLRAVEQLARLAGPVVVLGGGGYNPWTLARYWTGLWGVLSGREIPVALPVDAQLVLRELRCDLVDDEEVREEWLTTLADEPRPGEVREAVRMLAGGGRAAHAMA
jgi:acetoin utilization protein AcuC